MRGVRKPLLVAVLLVVMGLIGANAFGFLGFGGTRWQEEVLLHDGRTISVERWTDRDGRHEIGQRPPIKEQRLTFRLPGTEETVSWKVGYCKEVGYADLLPLLLDIVNETPYLVTRPVACLAYNKWKRPNPPYIVFRYTNNDWQQIELQELPMVLKIPNLIISSPDIEAQRAKTKPISAEQIRKLNGRLSQPELKNILREPLEPGVHEGSEVNCEEMIDYKCNGVHMGWGAPGEFSRRYFENKCKQTQ